MTNTIAKLLLSVLSLFLCGLVYTVISAIFFQINGGPSDGIAFIITGLITMILSIALWWLIWARNTIWTSRRILTLVLVLFGSILVGSIFGVLVALPLPRHMLDFAAFAGSVLTIFLALGGFVLTIRETPIERTARLRGVGVTRVHCPTCNYDMTGLHTSDCPECGGKFTVEEFIARLREQQSPPTIDSTDN